MYASSKLALRAASSSSRQLVASRATLARCLHSSPSARALQKFAMPAMSPTMTEGGIASWKKKEGEAFSAGDVLLEIETDKATMDVEASDDGILAKIIVNDGAKNVAVNSVIAITAEEGDDLSGADALAAEAEKEGGSSPKEESSSEEAAPKKEEKEESAPAPAAEEPKKSESSSSAPTERASGDRIFASPLARKIAQEKGIPLGQVKGTGPNGRITKTDVESYKPSSQPQASSSSSASAPAPSKSASTPPPPPPAAGSADAGYTDIPVSSMRRVIAQRLTESKQNLPHYYVSIDVEMDRVLQLREVFNTAAAERAGPAGADKAKKAKLSVGDFVTKAAAVALREVPEVNSAWYGETIRQFSRADISIAVSTPTGLITPILKDVTGSGLTSISTRTKELASRARDGKLKPDEYQGGTFTISNMGMFGITHFTAIINSPQSAILAIGGTEQRIVPDDSAEQGWKKVSIMQATLSSDHRIIDGATAAKWMKAFKDALENPLSFML